MGRRIVQAQEGKKREPIGMAPTDAMLARQGRENGSICVLNAANAIRGIPMWVRRAQESNGLGNSGYHWGEEAKATAWQSMDLYMEYCDDDSNLHNSAGPTVPDGSRNLVSRGGTVRPARLVDPATARMLGQANRESLSRGKTASREGGRRALGGGNMGRGSVATTRRRSGAGSLIMR